MTDRDRVWDAEHHRAVLQIIAEADRGLKVAEQQLKAGRLMDARETVRIVRGLMPPLERAIQRRPVRTEEPIVHTVGDLTARHIGKRVRGRTWEGELLLLQASVACVDIVLEGKPYPYQLCLTLDTPCEVLP